MKITRLPLADRMANEVMNLNPSKANAASLGKIHSIITGNDKTATQVRTRRQFRALQSAVVNDYLNKVTEMKAHLLKRPNHSSAARFELSNMYWMIGTALDVNYNSCND